MELYEAIKRRISVRKYQEKLIDSETKEKIVQYIENCKNIYEGQNLILKLIDNNDLSVKNKANLGFAGGLLKINAPHYIVAISEEDEGFLENAGFVQEGLVLELTKLGIATCWLGTFNEKYLRQSLNLKDKQIILNVIALGYEYEGKSFAGSIRNIAGGNKRKSIDEFVYYKEFGNKIKSFSYSRRSLETVCCMSALYPSANNNQPVYLVIIETKIVILIKSKDSNFTDRKRLDAGIFMAHLYLTCLQEGYNIKLLKEKFNTEIYKVPDGFQYVTSFSIDKEWR